MRRAGALALLLLTAACPRKQPTRAMPDAVGRHFDQAVALADAAVASCKQLLAAPKCAFADIERVEDQRALPPLPPTPLATSPDVRQLTLDCIAKDHDTCRFQILGTREDVESPCDQVTRLDGWPELQAGADQPSTESLARLSGAACRERLVQAVVYRQFGAGKVMLKVAFYEDGAPPGVTGPPRPQ